MGNYMGYERFDTANGEGVRSSVFFSGCSLRCVGCWNPSSWNPKNGSPFTQETIDMVLDGIDHPAIAGLSLIGGEPFENLESTIALVEQFRVRYGNTKTIWSWSGYTFEQIMEDSEKIKLIQHLDVLVEGRFMIALRDRTLKFRGSKNQRILDAQQSIQNNTPILIERLI